MQTVIPQTMVSGPITVIPARYPQIAYNIFRFLTGCMKTVEDGPVHLQVLIGLAKALRSTSRIQDCTFFAIQHILRDVLAHCDLATLDQYQNVGRVMMGFQEHEFCTRTSIIAIFRSLLIGYAVKRGPDGLSVVQKSCTTSENVQCTGDELHRVTLPGKHAQGYPFVAEADGNLMPRSCLASHAIGTAWGSPNVFHKVKAL